MFGTCEGTPEFITTVIHNLLRNSEDTKNFEGTQDHPDTEIPIEGLRCGRRVTGSYSSRQPGVKKKGLSGEKWTIQKKLINFASQEGIFKCTPWAGEFI